MEKKGHIEEDVGTELDDDDNDGEYREEDARLLKGSAPKPGDLTTPEEFFREAKRAGFRLVVTSFRDNQLARDVSSFEMHKWVME